jgi:dihydrofolate reductase
MNGAPRETIIAIIVAVAENGVIGRDGRLPWHISSDLKRFRALTMGKPVIMGRKTFQSLARPLDGRDNIVITRNPNFRSEGATFVPSFEAALALARERAQARGADEIMVIGGAEVYRAALPLADRIYLTRVRAAPAGDTFFPEPASAEWQMVSAEELARGPSDDYAATLFVLDRISRP